MFVTKHLLFARQEEGSVDQISQEGQSAWKQTARTEANPPSTGTEWSSNRTYSGGGQRRRMVEAIRSGEMGKMENHRGETTWKTMGERQPLRRCEVAEKDQEWRFRPALLQTLYPYVFSRVTKSLTSLQNVLWPL